MTLKELSQLYYLSREIDAEKLRLAELHSKITGISSPSFSGMPHGTERNNKTERICDKIADTEAIIEKMIEQYMLEQLRLEQYINTISDSMTRQIFRLRFIKLCSWEECAGQLGAGNTGKNCSNICYRYLKNTKI